MASYGNNEQPYNAEFEENVTCPVCLSRFDEVERKPKYLAFCCHTICRLCLNKIAVEWNPPPYKRVACPICRHLSHCPNGIDGLPTNGDKLFLLKLEKPARPETSDDEVLDWCFTCRKKTGPNCSSSQHSVIVMNPQLLNSEIQLNMASISSGIRTYGEATVRHRCEIATRLEQISSWLASYQKMIDAFKAVNQNRITQLNGMLQGTNLTVSVQKLMQLSIKNEQNLGILKDGEQEEAMTNKLLQELRSVEQVAEAFGSTRKNPYVVFPQVPTLRKELDYDKHFPTESTPWPAVFLDVISNVNSSSPSFNFATETPTLQQPNQQQRVSPVMFRFPPAVVATPPANSAIGREGITGNIIRLGLGRATSHSASPAHREIISVRRRR